jgi:hypothetical protein
MRAIRTWGSVRGVPGNWHPYRDQRRDATRAPTQRPEWRGGASRPKDISHSGGKRGKSQGFGDRVPKDSGEWLRPQGH